MHPLLEALTRLPEDQRERLLAGLANCINALPRIARALERIADAQERIDPYDARPYGPYQGPRHPR